MADDTLALLQSCFLPGLTFDSEQHKHLVVTRWSPGKRVASVAIHP